MTERLAITGAEIFDGEDFHHDRALLIDGAMVMDLCSASQVPTDYTVYQLDGGLLAPGYLDLQVNGGGGVQFNDKPSPEAIETICQAHRAFGTTGLLVTLITDTPEITEQAIDAGIEAARRNVPGFQGLHLEGPFLSRARKGAHDPDLIRPMTDADVSQLLVARSQLPNLMVTVACEAVSSDQIRALSEAGIVVSLGHSDARFSDVLGAADAGATSVTHLFNAMSPLAHREPGMVGAALRCETLHAGLIADGIHVDAAAIGIALDAKKGPGRIFLVTDAMAPIGTDIENFELNRRTILRKSGRLVLEDGTLAGADLDMQSAVLFMHREIGLDRGEAIRMATLYPAECLGVSESMGRLRPGYRADLVHWTNDDTIDRSWVGGLAFKLSQDQAPQIPGTGPGMATQ